MDDVLSKIVDHCNHAKQIGPVKRDLSVDKQSDGKDSKKKGDKSVVANPAISDGAASSKQCQLCNLPHSAINFPMFQALKQQDAVKRGELFPGKSDKDCKR